MIQPDEWVAQPPWNTNKTRYIDINHWICTISTGNEYPMKFTVRVSKKHPQKVCCVCVCFFFFSDRFLPPNPNRPNRVPIGSETSFFCLRNAKPVDRLLEPKFTGCGLGWLVGKKHLENLRLKNKTFLWFMVGDLGGYHVKVKLIKIMNTYIYIIYIILQHVITYFVGTVLSSLGIAMSCVKFQCKKFYYRPCCCFQVFSTVRSWMVSSIF